MAENGGIFDEKKDYLEQVRNFTDKFCGREKYVPQALQIAESSTADDSLLHRGFDVFPRACACAVRG